jgi:NAD(P)-dependent dehydrogenase (short-subunit alcohol dehydrogenase family)
MKTVLIIGGNGSLGKQLIKDFSNNGFICISPSKLELNLSDRETIEAFCDKITTIDGVICVAGKEPSMSLKELSWEHLTDMINIHYKGILWCIKKLINKIDKGGFIIFTSSVSSFKGSYDPTYSSLKNAINGLTKTLSIELSPDIRVNSVAPSLIIDTPVFNGMSNNFKEKHLLTTPLNRLVSIEEVSDVFIFLSKNKHITGQIININGGQYV